MNINKTILAVAMLLPTYAYGTNCKTHKIYCSLVELNPIIDKEFAFEISNIIYKYAEKYKDLYGGDADKAAQRSIAIAMQETSLRAINKKQRGVIFNVTCLEHSCTESVVVVEVATDIGFWQFHIGTALRYNMDLLRLRNDAEYATEQHYRLMKEKMKMCNSRKAPWACYHSMTPEYKDRYEKKVNRHYRKINRFFQESDNQEERIQ